MKVIRRTEHRLRSILSRHPKTYAFIVGIGIVLFWRGVWHSADQAHEFLGHFYATSYSTSLLSGPWWDGPLSLLVGTMILMITGGFTASFIGNELILSGLRGEKRLTEKTEGELKTEITAIADIQDELVVISKKLEALQKHADSHHHKL
jgi:hypothetical protein